MCIPTFPRPGVATAVDAMNRLIHEQESRYKAVKQAALFQYDKDIANVGQRHVLDAVEASLCSDAREGMAFFVESPGGC
eukprot:26471-Chlamydomonas_euryale.AAC.1